MPHLYPYEERGGTRHTATCLGADEHCVIKTLVMEPDGGVPSWSYARRSRGVHEDARACARGQDSNAV